MSRHDIWPFECLACRAELGIVERGVLTTHPATLARIVPDGTAFLRCRACNQERPWHPGGKGRTRAA